MQNINCGDKKDFLFADVVCHTMLSLYLEVAYANRQIRADARALILLKQLKLFSKMTKYKAVKADIRRLIHYGRSNCLGFEAKMWEIQALAELKDEPIPDNSDLHQFQRCLSALNELSSVNEMSESTTKSLSAGSIYLNKHKVLKSFNKVGCLLSAVEVYVPSDLWETSILLCDDFGWQLTEKEISTSSHLRGMLLPKKVGALM